MRIYTRTGDRGETGLFRGKRVSKASLRIEAYGSVDEVNSLLGLVVAETGDSQIKALIQKLQNELHIIEADLANPSGSGGPRIQTQHVTELEKHCDRLTAELAPLTKFILPGGSRVGALLHLARTVARRAERHVVALAAEEEVNPEVLKYLNRLSDLLFLIARIANQRAGAPEIHPTY